MLLVTKARQGRTLAVRGHGEEYTNNPHRLGSPRILSTNMYVNDTRNPLSRHQIYVERGGLTGWNAMSLSPPTAKGDGTLIASPQVSAYNQDYFRSARPFYTLSVLLCI